LEKKKERKKITMATLWYDVLFKMCKHTHAGCPMHDSEKKQRQNKVLYALFGLGDHGKRYITDTGRKQI
jgi:hypothetical protein